MMHETQQQDHTKLVTVSAPGKILLVGGYLVLESPNVGFVIAANKRFYTSITSENDDDDDDDDDKATTTTNVMNIHVESPQFHMRWKYTYNVDTRQLLPSSNNVTVNQFVEKSLRVTLLYIQPKTCHNQSLLRIVIQADNDFYSVLPHLKKERDHDGTDTQRRTPEVVAALPRFLKCPIDSTTGKTIINKTGLGSSAALTTSLVGALVYYFHNNNNNNNDNDNDHTGIIHNLSQLCHCYAQGKVGSGFDISSACYGTHVYTRFPKCLLSDIIQQLEHHDDVTTDNALTTNLQETLTRLVELHPWKENMVQSLVLPNNDIQILLADVYGGSESPSMAKTILQWKTTQKGQTQDNVVPYWTILSNLNSKIIELLQELSSFATISKEEYDNLSKLPAIEWPKTTILYQLYETFQEIRYNLKAMGDVANVPIEPEIQTQLCNATQQLPGVITTLVPGAGGYDAVVCLYINRSHVVDCIGKLWSEWNNPIICPLNVQISNDGIQVEKKERQYRITETP